ncbi:hypothetical protein [Leptospira licerasiae]|uniref:hypothetical protein n=1 Tax=Leptospira licerasiae TaxID=447106 RepID=UPI001E62D140|nr:hypothetical protein [Leptospira licerasiae]
MSPSSSLDEEEPRLRIFENEERPSEKMFFPELETAAFLEEDGTSNKSKTPATISDETRMVIFLNDIGRKILGFLALCNEFGMKVYLDRMNGKILIKPLYKGDLYILSVVI